MGKIQKIIDILRGKNKRSNRKEEKCLEQARLVFNKDIDIPQYKSLYTTRGLYHSGASALLGFLDEFDNTFVFSNCNNTYSKQKKLYANVAEVSWFRYSYIFDFLDAFHNEKMTPLEKDIAIKRFVRSVYVANTDKMLEKWDFCPEFYNTKFFKLNVEFLKQVIDFTPYDLNVFTDNPIPFDITSDFKEKYKGCSFNKEDGSYIFYKYKNMSKNTFDNIVSIYLQRILNMFKTNEFLIYNQIFDYKGLQHMNYYLKNNPIKQILVYRDPRDQFMSAFKCDYRFMPRTVDGFCNWFKENCENEIKAEIDNRLIVRFEDLVLKYDDTTKIIMDFIGLKKEHHSAPKTFFEPEISKKNIGAWKNFCDKDFMQQIKDRLHEYCL